MVFKVIFRYSDTGESDQRHIVGPDDATIADCERVLRLVATAYSLDPDYLDIRVVPERPSRGFLHPLYSELPDGRRALVTGWYF